MSKVRIRMLTTECGPEGNFIAGREYTMDAKEAEKRLNTKPPTAEIVKDSPKETATGPGQGSGKGRKAGSQHPSGE